MKYYCYSEALRKITSTVWEKLEAFDLAGLRKKIGDNLQDKPGMPDKIFLPSEMQAAEMRANIMKIYLPELVVTLVCKITYNDSKNINGIIQVQSVFASELDTAIECMKSTITNGTVKVLMAYSEETGQLFAWNDLTIDEQPRLPAWSQKYERKRKAYRK